MMRWRVGGRERGRNEVWEEGSKRGREEEREGGKERKKGSVRGRDGGRKRGKVGGSRTDIPVAPDLLPVCTQL